jgi:hypothetical protein
VVFHVREPEVFPAGEALPARDLFAEKLAWLMDGAISIGRWSIGLDGILGLVPGLGDMLGAIISMIIVLRAVQAGIPRVAIARMMTNIAIDTFVGSIPVFGDAFDFAYKSNIKNVRIYEEALRRGRRATARHWAFFLLLFLGVGAVAAAAVFALMALIRTITHAL